MSYTEKNVNELQDAINEEMKNPFIVEHLTEEEAAWNEHCEMVAIEAKENNSTGRNESTLHIYSEEAVKDKNRIYDFSIKLTKKQRKTRLSEIESVVVSNLLYLHSLIEKHSWKIIETDDDIFRGYMQELMDYCVEYYNIKAKGKTNYPFWKSKINVIEPLTREIGLENHITLFKCLELISISFNGFDCLRYMRYNFNDSKYGFLKSGMYVSPKDSLECGVSLSFNSKN